MPVIIDRTTGVTSTGKDKGNSGAASKPATSGKSSAKKRGAEPSPAKPIILAVIIVLALVAVVFAVMRGSGGPQAETINGSNAITPPTKPTGQTGHGAGPNPAGGAGRPSIMGGTAGTTSPPQGNAINRGNTGTGTGDTRREYSPSGIGD
jgi:hypothetical protein